MSSSAHAPWSARAEFAATTAFWVLLTGLLLVRRAMSPFGFVALTPSGVVGTVAEYAVWIALTPVVFALARRSPLERGHVWRRLVGLVAVGLALAAAVEAGRQALLGGLVDVGVLDQLPGRLGGRPRRGPGAPGPLGAVRRLLFVDEFVIYAGVLAAGFARDYAVRAVDRETEAARLAAERAGLEADRADLTRQLADARLSALRMQLNPHFLFNALNAVSAYVERDPERAQTMLAQLAALLRRVLDGDARPEVPLADELALLRDYLAIQQARFGDTLAIEEDVDPAALGVPVPPLVLQPLVENAVEHGVSRLVGAQGRIVVTAQREEAAGGGTQLRLAIADNGPGPDGLVRGTGVGLANTRDRLHALYGDAAALRLERGPDGGAVAVVEIPVRPPSAPDA
ncbi:histidine kinase [Rubrivirga sp. S365]|uniref:sensor histidine kinase n=1 Tax=Rubrivirga sp. S365 TaxID=3076080 RepID=UPI0028C949E2|nr:histidine kinase [Rubrivirga sp. S365]MDT7858393.1 histidine kinase [Rubrivirga sp. S365]